MTMALMVGGPLHGQTRQFTEDGLSRPVRVARELPPVAVTEIDSPIRYLPDGETHHYELRWYRGRRPWQDEQPQPAYLCMDEPPRRQFPVHDAEQVYYLCLADDLYRAAVDAALPPCVVPDCGEKGRQTFTAAEPGRLAGREWQPGDKIRLCPRHGYDVARAAGARGMDELPDWLKADATWDPLDLYDGGTDLLYGAEILARTARVLRLAQRWEKTPS
jgi:hypothetical protein